jgi:hypothetical protein
MIRHAAAVAVAACLSVSPVQAQTAITLRVTVTAADVHKSPSVGSPVIGKAPRGTELVVTREIGDWVKVSWPPASDGAGYLRVSAGTLARGGEAAPAGAPAAAAPARAAAQAPVPRPASSPTGPASLPVAGQPAPAPVTRPSGAAAPATPAPAAYLAPTHGLGVGLAGGGWTAGFGASARVWSKGRLGAQIEVSRYSFNPADFLSRATSTDIAPGVLVSIRDHVSDRLWLRPYVGVAAHLVHSSRTDLIFLDATATANTVGASAVAGAEMTFSSVPRFGLSAGIGYYHLRAPFVGYDPGGVGVSVSGHWYVK